MYRAMTLATLAVLLAAAAHGDVWYVDQSNTGPEDGRTWATAFTTIQPALDAAALLTTIPAVGDAAVSTVPQEIWVAAGDYDETRANQGTLVVPLHLRLYGGFKGTETARDQRDWETWGTTIDGSTARNGAPAYHVVKLQNNTVLDGFTVTGGRADSRNYLDRRGGGIYAENNAELAHCAIVDNQADEGGGIYAFWTNLTVRDCYFANNTGSAVYAYQSAVAIENSRFENNWSRGDGGAINSRGHSILLVGCSFLSNRASDFGGAVNSYGSTMIEDCLFVHNSANYGGAIRPGGGKESAIRACRFVENMAFKWGFSGGIGGAVYGDGYVALYDSVFERNYSDGDGGAVRAGGRTLHLTRCTFRENETEGQGGALLISPAVTTSVEQCRFIDNFADFGGAIRHKTGAWAEITNSEFRGNLALDEGDAISNVFGGGMLLEHCTLTDAIFNRGADLSARNSIFWADAPLRSFSEYDLAALSYCLVKGGFDGEGNLDADPRFVAYAPTLPSDEIDLHLQADSPAINAGYDGGVPLATDLDGIPRPQGAGVDMGAYEFVQTNPFDVNNDQVVNILDLYSCVQAILADDPGAPKHGNADINQDGRTNIVDLQMLIRAILESL